MTIQEYNDQNFKIQVFSFARTSYDLRFLLKKAEIQKKYQVFLQKGIVILT